MNRIEIFRDWQGAYRWRLVAETGRVLAASGEAYRTAELARGGARHVADTIPAAEVRAEVQAA